MNASLSRPRAAGVVLLVVYVAVLIALSWKRWGDPVSDVGLDLSTAAGWLDGVVPYRDVRYWYGPLGISLLAGAFGVFGTSLWTAIGVGFVITALIAWLTWALARRWLPTSVAAAVCAVALAIGFSGSMFNLQLPHTFAATTGLAALLAALLALSHRRFGWAGVAVGLTALCRPEFLAFGLAALAGGALGLVRERGARTAVAHFAAGLAAAVVVALPVLGWFFAKAGAQTVIFDNIVPLDFLRNSSANFDQLLMPRDLPSIGAVLVRGAALVVAVWAALALLGALFAPAGARRLPGRAELRVVVLGAAAVVFTALLLGAVGGDVAEPVRAAGSDAGRLLLAMSGLPLVAALALLACAVAWLRSEQPPLGLAGSSSDAENGPGWTGTAALVAAAGACALRAYGQFTTDLYASYYAAPVVVVAAILIFAAAARLETRQALGATLIVAAMAATLTIHAAVAKYPHRSELVHSGRGDFYAEPAAARSLQQVIDDAAPALAGDRRVLALPQEPGLPFLLEAQPPLYDATFLPGVLATPDQDRAAATALITGKGVPAARLDTNRSYRPPPIVIVSNRNLESWGFRRSGTDVNVELQRAITRHYDLLGRYGDTTRVPPATERADAFTVYLLR